ncbi:MAG TPA: FAD-dependent oxidoreductase [Clostridia bacterium]|nr:FAD-dependent oxidoreductase [Clostridia bacterium]
MEISITRTDRYDLVVCGGGPAGFACAVSAARKGLKVALVERSGCLGGTATGVGINQLLGGRKLNEASKQHVRVVGGLFDELTDRLIAQGDAVEPNTIPLDFNPHGWYPRMASGIVFDENAMKIALDDLCEAAGVRVYYNTVLTGAEKEGARIAAAIVWNKDGFIRLRADSFADCTGDADLACFSGCACDKGRDGDNLMTPCSVEMHLEHVDAHALVSYQNEHSSPKLVEIIRELKEKGVWTFPHEMFVTVRLVPTDVFLVNVVCLYGVDGTSEASVSRALADGRRECLKLFHVARAHFPGFENARIRKIGDVLGVRETRRIHGRYTVTVEDALSGRRYDDCIAATTYNFDLLDPVKHNYDPMMGDTRNPNANRKHVVIRIPYRSLLPISTENLIVAGRCVSTDREVLGPVRIMGPCMMMGQAAGTAAALSRKHNGNFGLVDASTLRETLWADGVIDPDSLPFD